MFYFLFRFFFIVFVFCINFAFSIDIIHIRAEKEQLKRGIVFIYNEEPHFIKGEFEVGVNNVVIDDIEISLEVFKYEYERKEEITIIPVEIEDKSLALGTEIRYYSNLGVENSIKIPPKKIFLPLPFFITVPQQISRRKIIIKVIPKITKKSKVKIEDTAEDGVVADIRYEGIAYIKFKDILKRMNRRDLDLTLFSGKGTNHFWTVIIENFFETYEERDIDVVREVKLKKDATIQLRADNIGNLNNLKFGTNLIYSYKRTTLSFGNIGREVKNKCHLELEYNYDKTKFKLRFQGIKTHRIETKFPFVFDIEDIGFQLIFKLDKPNLNFSFGSLKVEDQDDQGEVDKNFNLLLNTSYSFGQITPFYGIKKFNVIGETSLILTKVGKDSWLKGEIRADLSYLFVNVLSIRFNDDFFTISGKDKKPLWQNRLISLTKRRDYFNKSDLLNKYDIDSIFVDFKFSRSGKNNKFTKEVKIGLTKIIRIRQYDIPVEFFILKNARQEFKPSLSISIREYI